MSRIRLRERFASTDITFGPWGRVLWTGLVLLPLWLFWQGGILAWPGLLIWAVLIVPRGLRDLWRPAVRAPRPEEAPRQDLPDDYVPIAERETPKRW